VTILVVVFDPCLVVLLRGAGLDLGLGGPLGLPGGQRPRGRVLVVLAVVAGEPAAPIPRMLGLDCGELLLGLLAPLDRALHHAPPIRRGLVQLRLEPVPLRPQLLSWGGAHVQPWVVSIASRCPPWRASAAASWA